MEDEKQKVRIINLKYEIHSEKRYVDAPKNKKISDSLYCFMNFSKNIIVAESFSENRSI